MAREVGEDERLSLGRWICSQMLIMECHTLHEQVHATGSACAAWVQEEWGVRARRLVLFGQTK